MSLFDSEKLRSAPVSKDPFDHIMVTKLLETDCLESVLRDFPQIDGPGSIPLSALDYGPKFRELIEILRGPDVEEILSEKFSLDLHNRPTMVTVRGHCRNRDGKIHVDSKEKLVTILLYLNASWEQVEGRLRLLREPNNIEDYVVEVPPNEGSFLAFKCTDRAWHGHKSFRGERKAIQVNWVTNDNYVMREQRRHKVSGFLKHFGLAT